MHTLIFTNVKEATTMMHATQRCKWVLFLQKQHHAFQSGSSSALIVIQSLSRVQFFETSWTVADQASLSFLHMCAKLFQSCLTLCRPMDCRFLHQAPLSMGFSRQEYWSELPSPPSGDLPDSRIEPASLMSHELTGWFFTTRATREAHPCPSLVHN